MDNAKMMLRMLKVIERCVGAIDDARNPGADPKGDARINKIHDEIRSIKRDLEEYIKATGGWPGLHPQSKKE